MAKTVYEKEYNFRGNVLFVSTGTWVNFNHIRLRLKIFIYMAPFL